jgi:hypothetical protein
LKYGAIRNGTRGGQEKEDEPQDRQNGEGPQEKPRLTIRELREAAQNAVQTNQEKTLPTPVASPAQQKKRTSIFGSLFQVREPTQVALNQVAAQIIAQHGSTSPTKVPNVRGEKMPDFVPKVNSKWDGVPDPVKQKEKKGKEVAGSPSRDSSSFDQRFRGQEGKARGRSSRNSSSTTGSFGSRGRSSGSHTTSTRARFYAQIVNSSGDLASQQQTVRSYPLVSSLHTQSTSNASEGSLPESPTQIPFVPRDIASFSGLYTPLEDDERKQDPPEVSVTGPAPVDHSLPTSLSMDFMPQHSASPVATPQETSPVTPCLGEVLQSSDRGANKHPRDRVALVSSGPGVLGPPAVSKRVHHSSGVAFLAGEAQELSLSDDEEPPMSDLPLRDWEANGRQAETPSFASARRQHDLERRPDSSRERLGLRASMLFRDNDSPWQPQDKENSPIQSPKIVAVASPKSTSSPRSKLPKSFAFFTKDKEKKPRSP